ncbi:MAG: hypothetical protein FJ096_21415, partial [Deltaproteobacteria bacterium]|nr:hypothetical protein [Deltaproteobacteria bacterium]
MLVALVVTAERADAKEARRNPALAEQLFLRGKDLLEQGKNQEACEAFEASQAADASVGALLNVARCQEVAGKPATAWTVYRAAATLAAQRGEEERSRGALELAQKLEQLLPRLTVDIL